MEEKANFSAEEEQGSAGTPQKRYTKQQNMLYTVISIVLFIVIYFGGGKVLERINRPYMIYCYPGTVSEEKLIKQYDICGITEACYI